MRSLFAILFGLNLVVISGSAVVSIVLFLIAIPVIFFGMRYTISDILNGEILTVADFSRGFVLNYDGALYTDALPFFASLFFNNANMLVAAALMYSLILFYCSLLHCVRVSNRWRDILLFGVGGLIFSIPVGFIFQIVMILLQNIILIIALFMGEFGSGFAQFIQFLFTSWISLVGLVMLFTASASTWDTIRGVWNTDARLSFIRRLPSWLRPQSFMRAARSWSSSSIRRFGGSDFSAVPRAALADLNDPLTGASLDPSKGITSCSQCKSFYHASTANDLTSMNQGRCIICNNNSIVPVTITQ